MSITRQNAKSSVSGLSNANTQAVTTAAIDLYLYLLQKGELAERDDSVRNFITTMHSVFGDHITV